MVAVLYQGINETKYLNNILFYWQIEHIFPDKI